jgi:hypothetical protein
LKTSEYFIGSLSPSGYKTNFSDTIDEPGYFTYILKGEASCSRFIERIAVCREELKQEIYYCAADPDSIDAVVFPERKVIVCDSIVPHLFEPKIAGVTGQIVNLSESWDTDKLDENRDELSMLHTSLTSQSERAERCIKALAAVLYDNYDLAKRTIMIEKLDSFFGRFTKKILPKHSNEKESEVTRGKVSYRYFSALTSDGVKTLIPKDSNVYILNDDYSAGANYLLIRIVNEAAARGFDVIVNRNPLMPAEHSEIIAHIAIPELNLYIFTSTSIAELEAPDHRQTVNFRRFYTKNLLAMKRQRMRFNNEAAESLLSEAVSALRTVRETKREIEQFYEKVIDNSAIDDVKLKIVGKLA